jgi:hypothetical protein
MAGLKAAKCAAAAPFGDEYCEATARVTGRILILRSLFMLSLAEFCCY